MDRLREFLKTVVDQGVAQGNFLGLLHVLIGRRIALEDGTLISSGTTWREVASLLKKVRWDRECVRELGLEPARLPPRDRERYWYTAITQARVSSEPARRAGDQLAQAVGSFGYVIGAAPQSGPTESTPL